MWWTVHACEQKTTTSAKAQDFIRDAHPGWPPQQTKNGSAGDPRGKGQGFHPEIFFTASPRKRGNPLTRWKVDDVDAVDIGGRLHAQTGDWRVFAGVK
jgi:hypothetical protein